jgi:hypothetical protein
MGGVDSGRSTHGWSSAGPEGQWAGGGGGAGLYPCELWDRLQAGILVVVGPAAQPRSGYSGMVWSERLRDGHPACVGLEQSCGLAQPQEQTALQNRAVALQTYGAGIWQGRCSYIRSWCGEAFHDLSL